MVLHALRTIHLEPKKSLAEENLSNIGLMLSYLHGFIMKEALLDFFSPRKFKYQDQFQQFKNLSMLQVDERFPHNQRVFDDLEFVEEEEVFMDS